MADISKITLPDNSTYNIKDSIARSGVLWYGTCNTLANTTEKAVTISGITSLTEGLSIRVKMLNEAAAASPTLNLNSLGAKAITRSAKPSLPSGYSRVLGFSMNDNSYFEIDNFKLTGADTVRFSFSMTANCNVFGCYTNSSATNNYSLFVSTSSTASYLRYNGGTYNSYIPAANQGQQLDVVITPHGVTGMPTNSSWTAKTFTTSSDMCIGTSSPDASSASLIGNLYGAFIVEGRFNGIPCERLSDNALGYYDTYSKTFYEPAVGTPTSLGYDQNDYFDNAGTGEWAAGEVLDLVYDGTSWIIVDGAIADEETYGYTKLSDSISSTSTNVAATANAVKTAYDLANSKQDALVSGTNIKTINNESLLGSGNIPISAEPEIYICDSTTSYNDVVREYEAGKTLFYHRSISDGDFDDHTYLSLYAVQFNEESEIYLFQFSGIFNNHSYTYEIEGEVQTWSYHVTNLQTSLPSQSSQAGKFLTTNGSSMSWGSISIPAASITTPSMDGTASYGSGTSYARSNHVHPTDTSRAPTSHASTATTYGTGTDSNYGHVKLSASTSSTSGVSDGIAATPSAVKAAYDLANGKYSKPNTGIPATDLESAVQTSLGKADTALQSESDPVFTASAAHGISSSDISNWNSKQAALESGTNIKTINNESLLGSGNITIQGGGSSLPSQTGHTGDILATDGTDPYWMDVSTATSVSIDTTVTASSSNLITSGAVATAISNINALPSQSGNSGKFLTTNGSVASWANAPTELFWATYGTTTNAQIEEAYQAGKEIVMNYDGRVYQLVSRASSSSHTFGCVYYNTYYQAGCALGSWTNTSTSLSLPSQSGHSGDFLTTNGTAASWADPVATSTLTIDSTPTANSNNLVKSGGVYAMIGDVESILTTLLEGTS